MHTFSSKACSFIFRHMLGKVTSIAYINKIGKQSGQDYLHPTRSCFSQDKLKSLTTVHAINIIWAVMSENVPSDMGAQQRFWSAIAIVQSD